MALKKFVKVSVNNLSDARYCAGMGVDLIGFNIDPNHGNHTSVDQFKEIAEWVAGVQYVGEFDKANITQITDALSNYDIQYIEFSNPELALEISSLGMPGIFRAHMPDNPSDDDFINTLQFCSNAVEYVLIDGDFDITSQNIQSFLKKYGSQFPILLGGNITPDNLDVLERLPVKGISLQGSDEIKPGYKDYDELADVLEKLEIDDLVS